MDDNCIRKKEEKQIRQLNGQIVMNALAMLNNNATGSKLTERIVALTGHPKKDVHHEVKGILDYGVANGFFMKTNNNYSLPCVYDVDSGYGPGGYGPTAEAGKFLDKCIEELLKKYPGFDYKDYIATEPSCEESDEEGEESESDCSTTPESESDRSTPHDASCSSGSDDRLSTEPGSSSESDRSTPHDASCSGGSEGMVVEVTISPTAMRRSFREDDEDEGSCEPPPEKKARCT